MTLLRHRILPILTVLLAILILWHLAVVYLNMPFARDQATRAGQTPGFFELLPQTFVQAFDMIRDGGRMVAVGIAPGKTAAPVEITRLVRRELRIVGSYGARTRSDMPEIIRLAAQGIFRPETMVTQRFSLDQADAGYQALARGEIVGRAIVVP